MNELLAELKRTGELLARAMRQGKLTTKER